MKVVIQSQKTHFFLLFPTALLLNPLTASIAAKVIQHKQPSLGISAEDFLRFADAIKHYKRRHRHWELVNIRSSDGETVYISF